MICLEDADHNHFPDYAISFDGDNVRFVNRNTMKAPHPSENVLFPMLDAETYHDARLVAPGYDVYHLEQQWREFWIESGRPELKSPDAAFLGFCKSRHNRKPNP
jgi:hypothetical protein